MPQKMSLADLGPAELENYFVDDKICLRLRGRDEDTQDVDVALASGTYGALGKVLREMEPAEVLEEVKMANLRGRGGAGFPAGIKWSFVPEDDGSGPRFLVVNADESEPGTFKDRLLMTLDPHLLLEGIAITCYAVNLDRAYIYIRGEFANEARMLERVIEQAYGRGLLGENILGSDFSLEVSVHRGAGAYICGEETALLDSLEGKRGEPRLKPPFPAVEGAFGRPTVVNNVETIHCVPSILAGGGKWFASLGTQRSGGTKIYAVSGHVERPGVYELYPKLTLRQLLEEHCGGIKGGRKLKAVIPGGSSVPVLVPGRTFERPDGQVVDEVDVLMDFDDMVVAGSMLGSAGVIVMAEGTCMVRMAARTAHFYAHESCGQCTPCRQGTEWLRKVLCRIEEGQGSEEDLPLLESICDNMSGTAICALSDAAAMPTRAFLQKFRAEFEEHIRAGECPFPKHVY